jgi:cytochrome c oxidase subunit IV
MDDPAQHEASRAWEQEQAIKIVIAIATLVAFVMSTIADAASAAASAR